jgi:Ion transport protein
LKLVAQGVLVHPNSYFRDGWNWFDALVVFAGLTEMTNMPNIPVKSFRALRVLRPLRSIRQLPKLRKLISGLLSSIPQLMNALFFMLFVFLQFSIFGSQQFSGAYYNRCRLEGGVVNDVWPIDESQTRLCSKDGRGY